MMRRRESYLPNGQIFGDPALALLLEVYVASEENGCVAMSTLCEGLKKPVAITSRWIAILQDEGLVVKCNTYLEQSGDCVEITDKARTICQEYLTVSNVELADYGIH
jgi:DNA-binding MarR family transcriptional regulator